MLCVNGKLFEHFNRTKEYWCTQNENSGPEGVCAGYYKISILKIIFMDLRRKPRFCITSSGEIYSITIGRDGVKIYRQSLLKRERDFLGFDGDCSRIVECVIHQIGGTEVERGNPKFRARQYHRHGFPKTMACRFMVNP